MTRIRLEIDEVSIYRPKKKWKLYFVIMTEHPTDTDKMVVTTLPTEPFRMSKRHENSYAFDTQQEGAEGLFVLSREMPEDRQMNVHVYLRHTRAATRTAGEVMTDLKEGIGGDAAAIVDSVVGLTAAAGTPWLVIAKSAISLVGQILEKIPDRDFGFLSAFERFGPEFETQTEIDRQKEFTGDASLVYSWSVDEMA